MGLISLGAGVAIGYALGTKKGKEQLDKQLDAVKKSAEETWSDPKVQDFVSKATETAERVAYDVASSAKKAAAFASEAVNKGSEKVTEGAEATEVKVEETSEEFTAPETANTHNGDVHSDPAQSTERKGTDWADEGGSKP